MAEIMQAFDRRRRQKTRTEGRKEGQRMSLFKKKEVKEEPEKEEKSEVEDFWKQYEVDSKGNYKYHDTPKDYEKEYKEAQAKAKKTETGNTEDDEPDPSPEKNPGKGGKNLEDDDDGR